MKIKRKYHLIISVQKSPYNKAQALNQTYSHKSHNLPYEVMVQIKQIYRDSANPDLLKKCLDQKTQNQNESFNNAIWSKIPKNIFVRLNTLKLGIFDAVLTFNNGFSSKLDVYNKLGIKLSENSVTALRNFDSIRLKKAEKSALEMTKEARVARKKRKLAFEEENEDPDDPMYKAGMF
uniref:Uncharacterized protein n=1 Tax=Clastoptera arizonana TaxID=38151 RepID=A0A1B6CIY4_9HEMI